MHTFAQLHINLFSYNSFLQHLLQLAKHFVNKFFLPSSLPETVN